jgi:hypothetical protein
MVAETNAGRILLFLAIGLMSLILATATQAENAQGSMSPFDLRPPTLLQKKIAACADKSWGDLCSFLVHKQAISARMRPARGPAGLRPQTQNKSGGR